MSQNAKNTTQIDRDRDLDQNSYVLEKFKLYETRARFFLIGSDRLKRFFRVLKIDRSEPCELNISEDPVVYSHKEIKSLLQRIREGNRATGGLNFVTKVYGIAGCIKFLESYYLIVATKRRQIGSICGHAIYSIEASQLITIPHSSIQTDISFSKNENRYKKLLSSVDLTKDFFYSYTYPIMQSLQKNVLSMGMERMLYGNIFVWNTFLTESLRSRCCNTQWTIALVHGYFKQVKLSIFGREFSVALISRRSRHFAGTRYLKRGVNDCGRVANDVETEQVVLYEEAGSWKGKMSSVVQMRGSIPLFWSQETSRLSPKPDIVLQRYDPTYQATKLHFEDLDRRYGNPIIILNLIKTVEKRPREMILRREFANAVSYLNQILPKKNQLKFIHWDFHKFSKSKSANVLAVLGALAEEALELVGFYYSGKLSSTGKKSTLQRTSTGRDSSLGDQWSSSNDLSRVGSNSENLLSIVSRDRESDSVQPNNTAFSGMSPRFQSGILRTNCIDCLDRTNVAQYAYGLAAFGLQLHAMGLTDATKIDPDSTVAQTLMDMYQNMGDSLAQQYGGSAAHNTIFTEKQGQWRAAAQSREFLKSIKRYYSNAYTDGEKQDAINLFLGYFQPQEGKPALWELDSDYYLHVSGIGDEPDINRSPSGDDVLLGQALATFVPIPAYQEDFYRIKLTSFKKLIEKTGSLLKDVRLSKEPDPKARSGTGNFGMAPDAAAIQLKSPNWIFGQRKYEENICATKVAQGNGSRGSQNYSSVDGTYDLNLLSCIADSSEDTIQRYQEFTCLTSLNETNGWYGGSLLYDQDEDSEIYQHYAELSQDTAMDPFQHDPEREKHYANCLMMGLNSGLADDSLVEREMEDALREYQLIGSDLGITPSCKYIDGPTAKIDCWKARAVERT